MRVVNYRPYCRRYALGSIDPISTPKDMLHAQCLHMGRTRTKVANDKMSRDEIQRISDWVESEMKKLMDSFLLFTNSVPLSTSKGPQGKGQALTDPLERRQPTFADDDRRRFGPSTRDTGQHEAVHIASPIDRSTVSHQIHSMLRGGGSFQSANARILMRRRGSGTTLGGSLVCVAVLGIRSRRSIVEHSSTGPSSGSPDADLNAHYALRPVANARIST
jgi:hypothetical protein